VPNNVLALRLLIRQDNSLIRVPYSLPEKTVSETYEMDPDELEFLEILCVSVVLDTHLWIVVKNSQMQTRGILIHKKRNSADAQENKENNTIPTYQENGLLVHEEN